MEKRDVLFVLLLVLALFFIYQHTFKYDLIWDTKLFVNESILFRENVSPLSIFKYGYIYDQLGISQQSFYYRPIVNLSFFLEYKLWGLHSSRLRLFNLFIFLLALLFLFIFLKKQDQGWRFAAMTTILFAFSPLVSENIIWVVGRCDLFLLLWGILTWLFLQLYIERGKKVFLICSLGFYILGIFSKETFLFFLPLLFAYEWIKTKKITLVYHLSTLLITLLFFLIKNFFLGIGSMQFFLPPVLKSLSTAVSVLGYYISKLFFPVGIEAFNFVHKVVSVRYLVIGILFSFLVLGFVWWSRKDKKNLIPIFLLGFFMLPYIILVFTSLWPFRISLRYMMLPFLGLIWFLCGYLVRLKKIFQYALILLLMALFIPEIVSSSYRYRSERIYWEHALTDHPENSFVHLKMAEACYEEWDDVSCRYYLTQALKYPMGQVTAVGMAVTFAKLEYQRMDYERSLDWMKKITFKVLPAWKYQINKLKALIYISRGNISQAENILKDSVKQFSDRKDLYQILTEMFLGNNRWNKAREWQRISAKKFPGALVEDIDKTEKNFYQLTEEKKMGFYIYYKNYPKAIQILKRSGVTGMDKKLLLIELFYKSGAPAQGKMIMDQLLSENPRKWEVANNIGFFCLKQLRRPAESIPYFQISLKINKNQPKIEQLISNLSFQLGKI